MPSKDYGKYAPKAWTEVEYEFALPSGDVCLLRKIDPLTFGEHGLLDKLDFATNVVMNTHAKNASLTPVERVKRDRAKRAGEDPEVADEISMRNIVKSAENSKSFREVMDKVLTLAVVAPVMHLPPEDPSAARDDEWFYTDAVPFGDKMAIFNRVMEGVRVVEQFREEPKEPVGDVAPKPGVQAVAKRTASPRKRSSS